MDAMTSLDPFAIDDDMGRTTNPNSWNVTNPSSISNSTQTKGPGGDASVAESVSLYMYLAVRILWAVLALFGNSLTILAVTRFERLQTCTNYFICSLAVSDLLSAVSVPLLVVYELYPNSTFYIPGCLLQKTFSIISSSGNLHNIMYMSIDRYIYIASPLRYHNLVTPRRTYIILAVTWVYFLLLYPTIMYTTNHLQLGMPCQYRIFLDAKTGIYLTPMLVLLIGSTIGFNLAIAKIAYKQARQIAAEQQPYNTLAVAINQSTRKISRTLGMVLGVYLLSYIPLSTIGLIKYGIETQTYSTLLRLCSFFYFANTWINPLIYGYRFKDFRIAFKKIFTGTGSFNEVPGLA